MTETRTEYDTEKRIDRLAEIERRIKRGYHLPGRDKRWLIAEIKRLRKQVEQLSEALEVMTQ